MKSHCYFLANKLCLCLIGLLLLVRCSNDQTLSEDERLFNLLPSDSTGISFSNVLAPTIDLNILDYMYYYNGGGVSVGDLNNDNLPDLYFTSSQGHNVLYLNRGDLKFEDITEQAGVTGNADWTTGTTMVDINHDGYLDIYVCVVSGICGLEGKNQLFINNGDLTFTERASEYHLDFETTGTQASFFDYDNDGDLDIYLLNHSIHSPNNYNKAESRINYAEVSGDKLLQNDNGAFLDVSKEAGIYGSSMGYGLGLSLADFNNDGYTDIYVSNDFHEDDYFYLNQRDGTFLEASKSFFGHISRFSMGSDVADINGDGFADLLTLDMAARDERISKASVGEDRMDLHQYKTKVLGYHNQYARNMLQINQSGKAFHDMGIFAGVSETDWSWSALFADYDLDGNQDLFVTNGIPKRPNDLDYINYIHSIEAKKQKGQKDDDQLTMDAMPEGSVSNHLFLGDGEIGFADQDDTCILLPNSCSNGAAYADLDLDGDLELIVNNIDQEAFVYENLTNSKDYLNIRLKSNGENRLAIGARVELYQGARMQYKELYPTRGFMSSVDYSLHFGLGGNRVDSIRIVWPGNRTKIIKDDIPVGKVLEIQEEDSTSIDHLSPYSNAKSLFKPVEDNLGISYVHTKNDFSDYNTQKLIPYGISGKGPSLAIGDVNHDGLEDIFVGNSRSNPAQLYVQSSTGLQLSAEPEFMEEAIYNDASCVILDIDSDGKNECIVGSTGFEYVGKRKELLDRCYFLDSVSGLQTRAVFPSLYNNTSVIKASDVDGDGDQDLFVGSSYTSYDFGETPQSYLLYNDGNQFKIKNEKPFSELGMVKDAIFSDFNGDGVDDLIVVGEWMAPTFLQNDGGRFVAKAVGPSDLNGLWQCIVPFDIDGDGDEDYVLGNWGLNSKYSATSEFPLLLFHGDVDQNGTPETIVATERDEKYHIPIWLDDLKSQITYFRKVYTDYSSYAGKGLYDIFDSDMLDNMARLEVHELASGYLENSNGNFQFIPFEDSRLQASIITNMLKFDYRGTGKPQLLVAGNSKDISPYNGHLDALAISMIDSDGNVESHNLGLDLYHTQVGDMEIVELNGEHYLLVAINGGKLTVFKIQGNGAH